MDDGRMGIWACVYGNEMMGMGVREVGIWGYERQAEGSNRMWLRTCKSHMI